NAGRFLAVGRALEAHLTFVDEAEGIVPVVRRHAKGARVLAIATADTLVRIVDDRTFRALAQRPHRARRHTRRVQTVHALAFDMERGAFGVFLERDIAERT